MVANRLDYNPETRFDTDFFSFLFKNDYLPFGRVELIVTCA